MEIATRNLTLTLSPSPIKGEGNSEGRYPGGSQ
jgi:hypothetical protein